MNNSISSIIRKQKVILTSGAFAVGAVFLIIACQLFYSPLRKESHLLSISIHTSQTGSVALYYDTGMHFREQESQSIVIHGDSSWHTYTFSLPNKNINALRFDPPAVKDAEFQIRDIRIINNRGTTLRRIEFEDVKPLHQIRHFERSDRVIRFQTEEISNDPQLLISPEHPIRFAGYHVLQGAFVLWSLIAGLGTFVVLLLTFHIFRTERPRNLKRMATFFVLAVLYLLGVWFLHAKVSSCFLEASIKTTSAETAQFYFDTGHGFSEEQTAALWVKDLDSFGQYRFPLPHETIYNLRFDPPSTSRTVTIKKLLVTDSLGRIIRHIPLHLLYPLHQIEKFNLQDDHLTITSTRDADDPQLGIHLQNPLQIPMSIFWRDPLFITIILALWVMTLLIFKISNKVLDKWIIIGKTFRSASAVLIYMQQKRILSRSWVALYDAASLISLPEACRGLIHAVRSIVQIRRLSPGKSDNTCKEIEKLLVSLNLECVDINHSQNLEELLASLDSVLMEAMKENRKRAIETIDAWLNLEESRFNERRPKLL